MLSAPVRLDALGKGAVGGTDELSPASHGVLLCQGQGTEGPACHEVHQGGEELLALNSLEVSSVSGWLQRLHISYQWE